MVIRMDKKVIEAKYYIPDSNQPGGIFYREFSGLGEFLPDSIEPLIKELIKDKVISEDIDFDALPIYLEMKFNVKIKATGASILCKGMEIKPYIAYRASQIKFTNKQNIIKQDLEVIKRYYRAVYNEEKSKYEKTYCKNI